MENRLLNQFNNVISSQWQFKQIEEHYEPLSPRELFELAYHTCNNITMRNVYMKQSSSEDQGGSKAILYSNTKKFISIEALDTSLRITKYYSEGSTADKLISEISAILITVFALSLLGGELASELPNASLTFIGILIPLLLFFVFVAFIKEVLDL